MSGSKFFSEKLPHASLGAKLGLLLNLDGRNDALSNIGGKFGLSFFGIIDPFLILNSKETSQTDHVRSPDFELDRRISRSGTNRIK